MARKRVGVRLYADRVEVIAAGRVVASHARSLHKGTETLVLDHYLEVLQRKPGALPGSVALVQARSSGMFTVTHERFWDEARRQLGDGAGTRALCKVLLLHRDLPTALVEAGIDAALSVGSVDPDVVNIECRQIQHAPPDAVAPVIPIEIARCVSRPAPSLDGYDSLLTAEGGAR